MPVEQERKRHRHDRILDAALQVFTRKGYHDAAMDEIAVESQTSKGGLYFHFPNKSTVFLALLDQTAALLRSRVEGAIASETDPVRKADIAIRVVLHTFGAHRTLARLFLVDAVGAGREFHEHLSDVHASFAGLIQGYLDEAVSAGVIPPLDTAVAGRVWFGALNEVVTTWLLQDAPGSLDEQYPTLRVLLLRSVGATAEAISRMESGNGSAAT